MATWSRKNPAVREAVAFLRSKEWDNQPESLVRWDARTGKRILDWNDKTAAHEWRIQQARNFINSFQRVINGMKVKAWVNIPALDDTPRGYYPSDVVAKTPALRERHIEGIVKRMASIAGELKLWRLEPREILAILRQLRLAMG